MAAGALIGNLAVNLSMETAAFQRGATIAEKRLGQMQDKFVGLGKKVAAAGAVMTAGITLPLVSFGKKAFQAASDAAELDSAFDQTFGKMAASMDKWAIATGNAMGRSTREIKDAANTFGIFFNTAMPPDKAAQMSQTFAKLAEDLGSFFNVDTETAIEKLRSGLAGEAEPLRAFGVFLSDAAVKAEAARMGIGGVTGALTEQEKIAVRAKIILDQTTKAQGDVARTSEGTANQIRRSQAAWEELQIVVGTKLLPVITPLIEKLAGILEKFSALSPATQAWVVGIGAVATVIGPVVTVAGGLITAFGALLPLVVKLAPAISLVRGALVLLMTNPYLLAGAALITGIYLAWKNWDKIVEIVQRVYTGVKTWIGEKLATILNGALAPIRAVTDAFHNMWDRVVGHSYVPDMVDAIEFHFGRLQNEIFGKLHDAIDQMTGAFSDMAVSGVAGFADALADVVTGSRSAAEAFGDMAKQMIADLIKLSLRMLVFQALAKAIGFNFGSAFASQNALGADVDIGAVPADTLSTSGVNLPGFARGGSGRFGGFGGIDRNVLSFNGSPIARVSRGERFSISPDNDTRAVTVHQHFQFEGVAITQDEFVRGLSLTKTATIQAINERGRRR